MRVDAPQSIQKTIDSVAWDNSFLNPFSIEQIVFRATVIYSVGKRQPQRKNKVAFYETGLCLDIGGFHGAVGLCCDALGLGECEC
jgi:hypothetical protein